MNVTGVCKVCKLKEVSISLLVGTLYFGTKNKEGEWDNHFFDAKFVGESIISIIENGIKNKDEINIKNALLKTRAWKDKNGNPRTTTEIVVFEVEKHIRENKDNTGGSNNGKSKFDK